MSELSEHVGAWEGSWRTFLRPGELHDESPVTATISTEGDGTIIEYEGSIQGQAVTGRMRWSEANGRSVVDWTDTWHTAGEPQRLEGSGDAPPSYQYGGDDPWTWDVVIDTSDSGVTITHHNAGPGIPRYVGVVMELTDQR